MPTIHPKQFKKIVVKAVNKHFDQKVYDDELEHHDETYTEEYINGELEDSIREFLYELEAEAERDELEADEQEEEEADQDDEDQETK